MDGIRLVGGSDMCRSLKWSVIGLSPVVIGGEGVCCVGSEVMVVAVRRSEILSIDVESDMLRTLGIYRLQCW